MICKGTIVGNKIPWIRSNYKQKLRNVITTEWEEKSEEKSEQCKLISNYIFRQYDYNKDLDLRINIK